MFGGERLGGMSCVLNVVRPARMRRKYCSTDMQRTYAQGVHSYSGSTNMIIRRLIATSCFVIPFLLSSCVGVSINDVRNSPIVYETNSKRSMNDVLYCLNTALDKFRGDGRIVTANYPQPPMTELNIGALQMGRFRHHYLVIIKGFDEGSKVVVRSAGTTYMPMSQSRLIKHVSSCT